MAFKLKPSTVGAEGEKLTEIKVELAEHDEKGKKIADRGFFFITVPLLNTEELSALTKEDTSSFEVAEQYLRGWRDITDENGNEVPYNDENRALVLNDPGLSIAIGSAIMNANIHKRTTSPRKLSQRR